MPAAETPAQPAVPETPNYGAPAVNVAIQNQEAAPTAAPQSAPVAETPAETPASAPEAPAEEAPAQPVAETAATPEVQPLASTPTAANAIPTDPHLQPQAEASVKKSLRNSVSQISVVTVKVIHKTMVKDLQ